RSGWGRSADRGRGICGCCTSRCESDERVPALLLPFEHPAKDLGRTLEDIAMAPLVVGDLAAVRDVGDETSLKPLDEAAVGGWEVQLGIQAERAVVAIG